MEKKGVIFSDHLEQMQHIFKAKDDINLSFGFICLKFNDIVSKMQQIAPKTILN